jgi:hypothetical protein
MADQNSQGGGKFCPKPATGWDILTANKNLLQTGDVIHVQSRGLLSKLIRFFSRSDEEGPSWASHSAMVLRVDEQIEIIEALTTTVIRPITAYKDTNAKLLVCRKPAGIDEPHKQQMIEKAEYYNGMRYGYVRIVCHALDRFFDNRYIFRRLLKYENYPICSWLVAYVYDRILKYQFGVPPDAAQPDDILDYCVAKDWDFIWSDSDTSVADFCKTYDLPAKNNVP